MQCSDFPQIRLPAGALPGRVTTHPLRLSPQALLPTTTISSITIYTQSPEISRRLSLSKISRQTRVPMDEFPQLKELGLRIVHTMGDGNCLFRALSDNVYGDQSRHPDTRAKICQYMAEHPEDFKPFIQILPGGGYRRNARRKAAAEVSSWNLLPTRAAIDRGYNDYVGRMKQNACWAGDLELRAFTKAYDMDLTVHFGSELPHKIKARDNEDRPMAHVVFHGGENRHYSAVRKVYLPSPPSSDASSDTSSIVAEDEHQEEPIVPAKRLFIRFKTRPSQYENSGDEAMTAKRMRLAL